MWRLSSKDRDSYLPSDIRLHEIRRSRNPLIPTIVVERAGDIVPASVTEEGEEGGLFPPPICYKKRQRSRFNEEWADEMIRISRKLEDIKERLSKPVRRPVEVVEEWSAGIVGDSLAGNWEARNVEVKVSRLRLVRIVLARFVSKVQRMRLRSYR